MKTYRVLREVIGGHRPGEVKPAAAFGEDADLGWLVRSGAVEEVAFSVSEAPVGGAFGIVPAADAPPRSAAELHADNERLAARVRSLESQHAGFVADRDAAVAALANVRAAIGVGPAADPVAAAAALTARVADLAAARDAGRADAEELAARVKALEADMAAARVTPAEPAPTPKRK